MRSTKEIRARLARVSLDDLDAVHDLYLDASEIQVGRRNTPDLEAQEVMRRVDRAIGQAVRAAQIRGDVKRIGDRSPTARSVNEILPEGRTTEYYRLASLTDDLFDHALNCARVKGNMSREAVVREVRAITDISPNGKAALPAPRAIPTARGRRTVEHLAIQMSAIALGVQEVDPGEIDSVAMGAIIEEAFNDIGIIRTFLRKVKKA